MNRNIIKALFLNGVCVALMAGSRQYHYVVNNKTWDEARAYCREKYTDLATISDLEELNSLTQNISGSVWIGLYNDRHDWKWSAGSSDFKNWESTHETDPSYMAAEEYAVMWRRQWQNHWSCRAHHFLCYNESQITSHGFVLIPQSKSWRDAQSYCREQHTDLATVKSATENQQIHEMAASEGVGIVWIGLYRVGWQWSDGSTFSQIFTLSNRPSGLKRLCVVLVRWSPDKNKLEAKDCSTKIPFVCYADDKALKRQIVRVQFQSTNMDLNATAAQADILDQIRRKLQEQGLPADAKLSWRKQPDGQIFHKKNEKKVKKWRKRKNKDEF